MSFYIGIEAEGPERGRVTLFVSGDETDIRHVQSVLVQNPEIDAVYFGAKDRCGIKEAMLAGLRQLPSRLRITIECDDLAQVAMINPIWGSLSAHFAGVHLVYVMGRAFTYGPIGEIITDVKVVDGQGEHFRVVWWQVARPYVTDASAPEYGTDRQVFPYQQLTFWPD